MAGRGANFWKDTPPAGKTIIIVGAAGLTGWGLWTLHKNAEARAIRQRLKDREQNYCGDVNLSSAAAAIYDACWNYAYGTMEDEETMVAELKRVPAECIKQLAVVYNHDYKKNLYEDFRIYIQGPLYEQVRPLLEQ